MQGAGGWLKSVHAMKRRKLAPWTRHLMATADPAVFAAVGPGVMDHLIPLAPGEFANTTDPFASMCEPLGKTWEIMKPSGEWSDGPLRP